MLTEKSKFQRISGVHEDVVRPTDTFRSKKVAALYAWWQAANGGAAPRRSLFDVVEHAPLIPHLFLVERVGPSEFRFRVRGEEVLYLLGGSPMGPFVTGYLSEVYGHRLWEYYDSVLALGGCKRCAGTLAFLDKSHVEFESIDCALADETGNMKYVIGVIESLPSLRSP